jgi:hypothetical protein
LTVKILLGANALAYFNSAQVRKKSKLKTSTSAAGNFDKTRHEDLRPPDVCLKTAEYLMKYDILTLVLNQRHVS